MRPSRDNTLEGHAIFPGTERYRFLLVQFRRGKQQYIVLALVVSLLMVVLHIFADRTQERTFIRRG